MDSTNSSSVSYKTPTAPGYVFKPDEDEIYSYFIPTRIRSKKPMMGVEEVDIYRDKSPDDLFQLRDPRKHIYLFTRLKKEKETHSRVKRNAGDGTWQCKSKPTVCVRKINGKQITIGIMRQLKYEGDGEDEWIMHEYCIQNQFLNYKININNDNDGANNNLNPEKIVFCHIYKKKAKKGNNEMNRNNEEFEKEKKRKRNCDCHEKNNHEKVDEINNKVSRVEEEPLLPEPKPEDDKMSLPAKTNNDVSSGMTDFQK